MLSKEIVYQGALNFLKDAALFAKEHPNKTASIHAPFFVGLGLELYGIHKKDEGIKIISSLLQWASLVCWIPSYSRAWGIPYIQPIALSILGGVILFATQADFSDNNPKNPKFTLLGRITSGVSKVVNVAIVGFTIAQKFSKIAGVIAAIGLGLPSAFNLIKA